MTAYDAGSAFIRIMPSFANFVNTCNAEMEKIGTEAAETFKEAFERAVSGTKVGPSDEETVRQGDSAGEQFADAFKAAVELALSHLPDASVGLDDDEAQAKLEEIRARLLALRDAHVGIDIDDAKAMAEIEAIRLDLDELSLKHADVTVSVDALGAIGELGDLETAADSASGLGGGGGGASGLSGLASGAEEAGSSFGPAAAGAAILATALIPIGAVAAGAALGLAGIGVAATAGLGAFALAAEPIAKQLLPYFSAELTNWAAQFQPLIVSTAGVALGAFGDALQAIAPLVAPAAAAFSDFFGAIAKAVQSPQFSQFITWLSGQIGPAISSLATTFIKFGGAFATMLEHSGPLIQQVEQFLPKFADSFAHFVASKTFTDFVDWVVKNGPQVLQDLANMAKLVGEVVAFLLPLGKAVLDVAGGLSKFVGWMVKANPLLQLLRDFVTDLDGPLTTLTNLHTTLAAVASRAWADIKSAAETAWNWIDSNVIQPLEKALSDIGLGVTDLKTTWDNVWGGLKAVVSQALADIQPAISAITGLIDGVKSALQDLGLASGSAASNAGATAAAAAANAIPSGARINHRGLAAGGSVTAGVPYNVGEMGKEVFVPAVNGTILNHHQLDGLGGNGGRNQQINLGGVVLNNEADVDILTRKFDFAFTAGAL